MTYLTKDEFVELGFDEVVDFDKLAKRAEVAINLYTQGVYQRHIDFDKEADYRKQAVKLAMAFQIAYLDVSGITTADDKQAMTNISIGRTSISYRKSQNGSAGQRFNLSLDAENILKQAGFSLITAIDYDR
jgi:phage protein|nr:MAG TPA: Putative Head Tail Connector Protein [Caudoviricetes sp.]